MNTDERAVAAALRQISAGVRPVRVPPDLWARGRRRRRLRATAIAAGVAALLLALIAVPLAWAPGPPPARPAEHPWSIPSRIRVPMPLQPNLVDAPNGPASVIVTGPGGFAANDVFGFDDRAIAVGRDGLYRYVRDVNSVNAGDDLLLSPDGRYLAGRADLEGVHFDEAASDWQSTAGVMDLTTGKVRTYREGVPVAWSPDDRLLVSASSGRFTLLDLGSGAVVPLGVGGAAPAFSPDGQQIALQQGRELKVLDVDTRTVRTVANLGAQQSLAGPGAWSAGNRLAIWNGNDCARACPASYRDFRLSFVDIDNGAVTDAGFDAVQAVSARLLGWRSGGDAVVTLSMTSDDPAGPHSGAPQVLSLRPGGGRTTLITVTADADRVDVARNLLDHFGGAPRSGWSMFLDLLRVRLPQAAPWLAAIAVLIAVGLNYRRIRAKVGPWLRRRISP
ncbi:TolB family protein [Rugosimonospora africana]|uniref:WD40 repeat domain-containing protein n=1 Tax=Rugosimonospora africana TaxID=556532 RepID=A0A8J3VQM7_9ACTN|nr:PD40 domain-containing protein [Rugosimonospora africana]GIH15207.1 hypothetical protein Raf01_33790 [Rugosimonospora africana]